MRNKYRLQSLFNCLNVQRLYFETLYGAFVESLPASAENLLLHDSLSTLVLPLQLLMRCACVEVMPVLEASGLQFGFVNIS
jgi:hypothetical protein